MNTTESKLSSTDVNELDSLNSSDLTMELNNAPLIEREEIEGTPFTIMKQNNSYYLMFGRHLLVEPKDNKEELINIIEERDWNVIMRMMCIISDVTEKKTEE